MTQESTPTVQDAYCPIPFSHNRQIVIGHGSGGKMSHDLIRKTFLPAFDNPALRASNDAGVVLINGYAQLAISTDTHVVWPMFFPGGDIGKLAVCGTVNDVAMVGAQPLYLTAGFILEEGLDFSILERVITSMQAATLEAGVQIVAGDTKVVPKGNADGMYINTTGIGLLPGGVQIGGGNAQPGDIVILSGPIGDHGVAVLAARGELGIETDIQSDLAPLNHLVAAMLIASNKIHVMRDPTRGGVATTLNEIAQQSNVCIVVEQKLIPVRQAVEAVCEMLGFDPLYIANEGKLLAIVARQDAERVLSAMHATRYGEEAVIIGAVKESPAGKVLLKTTIGGTRIVDMLAGEILPRIC